jgi:hypothetical protein
MKKKMLGILTVIIMVASSIALAGLTAAHWDENKGDTHKMHWAQTPDTSDNGVAVNMPIYETLGDDFKCAKTGYINDIHLWGAFDNDEPSDNDPGSLRFALQIWSDFPSNSWRNWSQPGFKLWERWVSSGNYTVNEVTYPKRMDWYNPYNLSITPDTHQKVYQYNFHFEDNESWLQEEGTIYWLVVYPLPNHRGSDWDFGWMTTTNELQWNDNAIRPGLLPMKYPNGDPVDLAFVINGTDKPPWGYVTLYFDFIPEVMNLRCNGRTVMCKIDPPEGYDTDDIDESTIELEDSISMSHPPEVGKIGHGKGNKKLMVKFDRSDLEDILSPGTHNLKISGQLMDGTPFVGYSKDIEVIRPGK